MTRVLTTAGAPAIAIVAILGLAVELQGEKYSTLSPNPPTQSRPLTPPALSTVEQTIAHIDSRLDYLQASRPTAVDLSNSVHLLKKIIRGTAEINPEAEPRDIAKAYISGAEEYANRDQHTNVSIGDNGVNWLRHAVGASRDAPVSVLTHCNTGSLATSGHGTALGIVRCLHKEGLLKHAFCTETRPYNQGSRLTAFELAHENIPATLVTDSMAAALMRTRGDEENMRAVIVGADRVAANGDTANKIGTYALAVLARHHGIKFIVAAPRTSIDLATASGDDIVIEERRPEEMTRVRGPVVKEDGTVDTGRVRTVATADQRVGVWNPAFDVTPCELIDAIVTEAGVVVKDDQARFRLARIKSVSDAAKV